MGLGNPQCLAMSVCVWMCVWVCGMEGGSEGLSLFFIMLLFFLCKACCTCVYEKCSINKVDLI